MLRDIKRNKYIAPLARISATKVAIISATTVAIFLCISAPEAKASVLSNPQNNMGLVFYAPMENATGTIVSDHSGRGNNGTMTNMATPPTATSGWGAGKMGKGLVFDGSDDYVVVNDNGALNRGGASYSTSVWVYTNSSQVDYAAIYAKTTNGVNNSFSLQKGSAQTALIVYHNDAAEYSTNITIASLVGAWHHIVITYDSNTQVLKAYLDNVLKLNGGAITPQSGTGQLNIGEGRNAPGSPWNGKIDDVRIYNRALSATEVASLYGARQVRKVQANNTGLVGYWNFEENAGVVASDSSGHNFTGTIGGATSFINGKVGKAINIGGAVGDHLFINNFPITAYPFSLSMWLNSTSTGNTQIIFQLADNTNCCRYFQLKANASPGSNSFTFTTKDGGATYSTGFSSPIIWDGKWHNIQMTFASNSTCILYFDRVSIGNIGCITLPTGMNSINIGEQNIPGASGNLNGKIDDVRFYNRALSATEVTTLYSSYSVGQTRINAPNNNGLVGYWNFEENAGTIANDSSGRGNRGTLTNMESTDWVGGKFGKGLSFDGSDDYVDIPALNLTTNRITFSAWVYPTGSQAAYTGIVYSRDPSQAVGMHYGAGGSMLAYTWNDNSALTYGWETNLFPPQNEWSFISIAIEPTKATAYMCTASGGCQSAVNSIAHIDQLLDTNFHIGWDENSIARHFLGKIDDVRIYNRALSATEVANLYATGR